VKPTMLAPQLGAHSAVGKGSAVKIEEDRGRRVGAGAPIAGPHHRLDSAQAAALAWTRQPPPGPESQEARWVAGFREPASRPAIVAVARAVAAGRD